MIMDGAGRRSRQNRHIVPDDEGDTWTAFRASVDALNAYESPLVLRRYQADILDSGRFVVTSPLSGRVVEVTRGIAIRDCIAYPIPDDEPCWLIAGSIGGGFPLYCFVRGRDRYLQTLTDRVPKPRSAFRPDDIDELMAKTEETGGEVQPPAPTLIIGNKNFAHHIWNELPGLEHWLRGARDDSISSLTILATDEPLGPLKALFPRLSTANVIPVTEAELLAHASRARITVRVGSQFVTEQVRERVRLFCREMAAASTSTPDFASLLRDKRPRIWVSVRVGSRTADNMQDFLLHLFRRTFDEYPGAVILLDGFSFSYNFFEDPRTVNFRDRFASFAQATHQYISDLRQQTELRWGSEAASRLVNISGITLAEAIELGAQCDYYVCHAGTLQHKIGWLHSVPGLVHKPLRKEYGERLASLAEGSIAPGVLPADHFKTSPTPARRNGPWNRNYMFVDPERSAEYVVNAMKSSL